MRGRGVAATLLTTAVVLLAAAASELPTLKTAADLTSAAKLVVELSK